MVEPAEGFGELVDRALITIELADSFGEDVPRTRLTREPAEGFGERDDRAHPSSNIFDSGDEMEGFSARIHHQHTVPISPNE